MLHRTTQTQCALHKVTGMGLELNDVVWDRGLQWNEKRAMVGLFSLKVEIVG